MRVLHLVAADRWTGAAAVAELLVEAQRSAGIECTLAFRSGRNLAERLRDHPWALPAFRKERSWAQLSAALAMVRSLAAGCDLVHTHLPHDHLLAVLALRRQRTPVVRSVRHAKHLRADPFHRLLFRRTAGVALANSAMVPLLGRFPRLPGRPWAVLPPVVEERFRAPATPEEQTRRRAAARAALAIPPDALVAGTVGKLERGRGHDLALRAFAAIPGLWALVVGHGSAEAELRALAARLGVGDRCAFAGYVSEGLEACYAAMDLFVFPAAGSDHGHRALVEAAGSGVPALAADLPGVRDLVRAGVTGDLYAAEDAAALAVLLRRWGADPELRASAGAAARDLAGGWTHDRLGAAAHTLYSRVVAGDAGPSRCTEVSGTYPHNTRPDPRER